MFFQTPTHKNTPVVSTVLHLSLAACSFAKCILTLAPECSLRLSGFRKLVLKWPTGGLVKWHVSKVLTKVVDESCWLPTAAAQEGPTLFPMLEIEKGRLKEHPLEMALCSLPWLLPVSNENEEGLPSEEGVPSTVT